MINSTNPFAPPVIDPKLLSTDFDITAMREAVETAFVFLSAPAWKDFIAEPTTALAQAVERDQALNEYIRNNASPTAHVIGTASMTSPDADYGVVNPDLSVKGLTGLRVVDSSVLVSVKVKLTFSELTSICTSLFSHLGQTKHLCIF